MLLFPTPAQHCVERRGETLTTAREAGTPTRLVRSNALFDGRRLFKRDPDSIGDHSDTVGVTGWVHERA